jgi:hypothetical protein
MRTVSGTLWNWALATSTTNTDTVDNIALLGLVTQTTCLIRTRWTGSTVDNVQLAKLYYALSANVQRVYSKDRHKDVHKEHLLKIMEMSVSMSTSTIFQYVRRANSKYWFGFDVAFEGIRGWENSNLSYLPAADAEKESEDIRLLLLVDLFQVFEGTCEFSVKGPQRGYVSFTHPLLRWLSKVSWSKEKVRGSRNWYWHWQVVRRIVSELAAWRGIFIINHVTHTTTELDMLKTYSSTYSMNRKATGCEERLRDEGLQCSYLFVSWNIWNISWSLLATALIAASFSSFHRQF